MNSLEQHIYGKNLSERESMNALQNAGMISDNCVNASDVAECDCTAAIAFLTFRGIARKREPAPAASPAQSEINFTRQPHNDP